MCELPRGSTGYGQSSPMHFKDQDGAEARDVLAGVDERLSATLGLIQRVGSSGSYGGQLTNCMIT